MYMQIVICFDVIQHFKIIKKTTKSRVGFSSFQTGGKFRPRIVCRSEINCQKCPYSIFYTGDEETSVNIETIGEKVRQRDARGTI